MKITYRNGFSTEGVALSQSEDCMRVAFRDREDVAEFHRIHGTWVSEECEPVAIEFGSRRPVETIAEEDCICPKDLAAHLVALLQADTEEEIEDARPSKTMTVGAALPA